MDRPGRSPFVSKLQLSRAREKTRNSQVSASWYRDWISSDELNPTRSIPNEPTDPSDPAIPNEQRASACSRIPSCSGSGGIHSQISRAEPSFTLSLGPEH
ncbi:hypothetical protein RRG08_065148 [Elysia crispata]|uniref:Uncharacterized protein n=1 Tax=Elysia crispata TaxID=231223 RepID=A0AAE0Z325_9GAST|nr:hypothetical protein RRG08_065148 [Elysia crispata]